MFRSSNPKHSTYSPVSYSLNYLIEKIKLTCPNPISPTIEGAARDDSLGPF